MRLRYKIGAVILCLSGLFGFVKMRGCDRGKDVVNGSLVLAPNESEAVVVDSRRHTITLITPTHTKSFTLPSRPSRVSLLKGDGIKISSPQYGTSMDPFLGAAYTLEGGKVLAGVSVFYYKKLDLSLGIAVDPHLIQHTTAFVGFSYLAYSNCSVGLGLDNRVQPMLFVSVKL